MEASEIIRRNEAVARFMGLTCPPTYDGPNSVGRGYYDPNDLRYHDEWQWLMPCVEKITMKTGAMFQLRRDDIGEGRTGYYCYFQAMPYGTLEEDIRWNAETMILATFLAVSEYCLSLEA